MAEVFNRLFTDEKASELIESIHRSAVTNWGVSVKDAILDCFLNVAWANERGMIYYSALENAFKQDAGQQIKTILIEGTDLAYGYEVANTPLNDSSALSGAYVSVNTARAAYYKFDLMVKGGENYRVEWDTSVYTNSEVMVSFITDAGIALAVNDQTLLNNRDTVNSFWCKSGSVIMVPHSCADSKIVGIRLEFAADSQHSGAVESGNIAWVMLTQTLSDAPDVVTIPVDHRMLFYDLNRAYPYYKVAANRVAYYTFDLLVTPGATYTLYGEGSNDAQITAQVFNTTALAAVNNGNEINGADAVNTFSRFQKLSAMPVSMSVPSSVNGKPVQCLRFVGSRVVMAEEIQDNDFICLRLVRV